MYYSHNHIGLQVNLYMCSQVCVCVCACVPYLSICNRAILGIDVIGHRADIWCVLHYTPRYVRS